MNKNQLEALLLTLDEAFHYVKDQTNNYLAQAIYEQMLTVTREIKHFNEDVLIDGITNSNYLSEITPLPFTMPDSHSDNVSNSVLCPFCSLEQNGIIATLKASKRNKSNNSVTEIIINEDYRIPVKCTYGFQTEANFHILFTCSNGHLHIESFDEHKGVVLKNNNVAMIELALYLNAAYANSNTLIHTLDAELMQHLKDYFNLTKEDYL